MMNGQDVVITEATTAEDDASTADVATAAASSSIEIIAARMVASVTPRLGPTSGGTNVTITGNKGILESSNGGGSVLCWFGPVASQALTLIER